MVVQERENVTPSDFRGPLSQPAGSLMYPFPETAGPTLSTRPKTRTSIGMHAYAVEGSIAAVDHIHTAIPAKRQ